MVFNSIYYAYYNTKIPLICHSKMGTIIYQMQLSLVVSYRQQEQFYAHKKQKDGDDSFEVLPPDYLNDTADNYST
jgi:hypothetical protein